MKNFQMTNWFLNVKIILILFTVNTHAQQQSVKNLQEVGKFIEKTSKEWKVPGVAVGVVKNGQIIYTKGFGYRDVEKNLTVDENTLFNIASNNKSLASVSIGQLQDKGLVHIDNAIREYIPYFKLYDDYLSNHTTVRDLLAHRTGIPGHDVFHEGAGLTREDIVKRLQFLEPAWNFRERWEYANFHYETVRHIVELKTGLSWEDYITKEIFAPLEMNTSFNAADKDLELIENIARPYDTKGGQILRIQPDQEPPSIYSSARDMCNWLLMNLNKGKFKDTQIISEEQLYQIHSPHILMRGMPREEEFSYSSYAQGWIVKYYKGRLMYLHGGNNDGFSSQMMFFPNEGIGVVVLANLEGTLYPDLVAYNIIDRLLGIESTDFHKRWTAWGLNSRDDYSFKEEIEPMIIKGTKPSHSLEKYAGEYNHPAYGKFIVTNKDGALFYKYNSYKGTLEHLHYNVFLSEGFDYVWQFHLDTEGKVTSISSKLQDDTPDKFFKKNHNIRISKENN